MIFPCSSLRKGLSRNLGRIYVFMFSLQVLFSDILRLPFYRNIILHDLFFSTLYLHYFLRKHVTNIYTKTSVNNRVQLTNLFRNF